MLQSHVDLYRSDYDDGSLPYHLCLNGLAEAINTHSVAHLGEAGYPRVHRMSDDYMRAIQGYSPAVCRVDDSLRRGRLDTDFERRGNGKGTRGTVAQSSGCAPPPSSRGHFPNPDKRRQEFLPGVTCEACRHIGHRAVNCDMLAMALCLKRYMKGHLFNAAMDSIESDWVNQWKDQLENPRRKPRQVMRTYLDDLDVSEDVLDAQFDWACWDLTDKVDDDSE
jgi:hypothetical protein